MQVCNKQVRTELTLAKVSYDPETNMWFLREKYCYKDEIKQSEVTVDKCFPFDLATIPRFFWRIVAIHELSIEATLIHDFMYESKGGRQTSVDGEKILGSIEPIGTLYSRKDADDLFLRMMEQAGVRNWRRSLAYIGVRLFGRLFWKPDEEGG